MFGAPPSGSTFLFFGRTIAVELFLDLILNTGPLRPLVYLPERNNLFEKYFEKKNLKKCE
jgi:hypothetical protein